MRLVKYFRAILATENECVWFSIVCKLSKHDKHVLLASYCNMSNMSLNTSQGLDVDQVQNNHLLSFPSPQTSGIL